MLHPELRIETDRLVLRPMTIEDIDANYAMNMDEAVSVYTGDGGVVSKEEIERRIKDDVLGDYKKYGYGRLAVELKAEINDSDECHVVPFHLLPSQK